MNWQRVILGGLVAGMLINLIEFFLNGVFLAKDWQAAMMALNRPPIVGESDCCVLYLELCPLGLSHRHRRGMALCGHPFKVRSWTEDGSSRGIVRLGSGLSLDFGQTVSPEFLSSSYPSYWPCGGTG
jgi:hypothetical protein